MSLDLYREVWGAVKQDVPEASAFQCRRWIKWAYRRIQKRHAWSFLTRVADFYFPVQYTTGTVTLTQDSTTVTGSGTVWTTAMEGRAFRKNDNNTPVYTVKTVNSATSLELERNWAETSASGVGYRIWQAYQNTPEDFREFITIRDARNNWSLDYWRWTQADLDRIDAQRSNISNQPYWVVFHSMDHEADVPVARYEFWPHQVAEYSYEYIYLRRMPDLDEDASRIPRYIDGDLLHSHAMMQAALWTGPDGRRPVREWVHRKWKREYEEYLKDAIKEDEERWEQMISQAKVPDAPWFDADWLQAHDVPPYYALYFG